MSGKPFSWAQWDVKNNIYGLHHALNAALGVGKCGKCKGQCSVCKVTLQLSSAVARSISSMYVLVFCVHVHYITFDIYVHSNYVSLAVVYSATYVRSKVRSCQTLYALHLMRTCAS